MYKLKTIDVWDTLLRRKGHPDLSKLVSARYISLRHNEELATPFKEHWAIFRERCAIEGELATIAPDGDGEYEFYDVLNRLLHRIFKPCDFIEYQILAQRLANLEFQFELRHTYPDPFISSFCREYPAEKTLFLSDFYMPAKHIQRLLQHHALDEFVFDGITSCDIGQNKRSGKLFHYIHSLYSVTPEQHVHIGDNLHSDVIMPQMLGIRAIHHQPECEHNKRKIRSSYLHDRQALFRHVAKETEQQAIEETENLKGRARAAYFLGVSAAPLFVGFMLYIAEKSLIDKVGKLFFFTREGEFFIKVWQALFPDNYLAGAILPEIDLLEISRMTTFCASLREITTNEMMRIWNAYPTQSMLAFLKTLGLEPEDFTEIYESHGLSLIDDVIHPWQNDRVRTLFKDQRFISKVEAKRDHDRSRILGYLNQKGIKAEANKYGVVDIGWRGTIQDNLAYLLPDCYLFGYYLGLQRFLNQQPLNCVKSAFGPDANKKTNYLNLLVAVSPIEMLCNSPNGSVTHYELDKKGLVIAKRLIDTNENSVHESFVTHFQQGVFLACRTWAHYVDCHIVTSSELRDYGCSIWNKLVTRPIDDLVDSYASLNHNEVFGFGDFFNKQKVPTIWKLCRSLILRNERREVILYLRQVQWVSEIWARKDLGFVHKSFLSFFVKFALLYKFTKLLLSFIKIRPII